MGPNTWSLLHSATTTAESCELFIYLRFVKCALKDACTVVVLRISKYAETVELPTNPQQT